MNIATLSTVIGVVTALAGGGYTIATTLGAKADKVDVEVLAGRTDYILDRQIESLLGQINLLEIKAQSGRATQYDLEQLKYLRDELKRMRDIRRGAS